MKPFVQMLKRRAAAALAWRSENREMESCGYVLLYRGEVCGWARELSNADAKGWCPGVLAIGVTGIDEPMYQATGGNDSNGATEWSVIWNPAPTAEAAEAATEDLPINL